MANWTQKEIAQLEVYLLENKTLEEISTLMDRTISSLVKKTMSLGYKKVWVKQEKTKTSKINKHNKALRKCFREGIK